LTLILPRAALEGFQLKEKDFTADVMANNMTMRRKNGYMPKFALVMTPAHKLALG